MQSKHLPPQNSSKTNITNCILELAKVGRVD